MWVDHLHVVDQVKAYEMLASPSDGERFQIGSDVAGCMREDSVDSQFDQAACDNGPYLSCYRAGGSSRVCSKFQDCCCRSRRQAHAIQMK
jgi:hypothetical protein